MALGAPVPVESRDMILLRSGRGQARKGLADGHKRNESARHFNQRAASQH